MSAQKTQKSEDMIKSSKRKRATHDILPERGSKRSKQSTTDYLTLLSDELLLRILTFLPLEVILLIQQLSHRYQTLSTDSQIWKGLYYTRFVLPRAVRGARVGIGKEGGEERLERVEASRRRWLMEEKLLEWEKNARMGGKTDWKARYRLRLNWCRGRAEVRRIGLGAAYDQLDMEVENKPIIRMTKGVAITASRTTGLEAWDLKSKRIHLEAKIASAVLEAEPTSLAIDVSSSSSKIRFMVGFIDGSFEIWCLNVDQRRTSTSFKKLLQHKSHFLGRGHDLIAVACLYPYTLSISANQVLSAFIVEESKDITSPPITSQKRVPEDEAQNIITPRLLASLKSHSSWPPIALSIRSTPHAVVASIAYSMPTYISGWSVGLQELHLSPTTGEITTSRLASAIDGGFHSLLPTIPLQLGQVSSEFISQSDGRGTRLAVPMPSSLSYSHPYLLVGHRDNTLTLYMVKSDRDSLTISRGTRLWGHTSEILGATIGEQGKAVSLGAGCRDVRVWNLEGGRRGRGEEGAGGSVRVQAELADTADLSDGPDGSDGSDGSDEQSRGWIGFDDEYVVVPNNGANGRSTLLVYDFT